MRDIDAELGAAFEREAARHADPWEGFLACCRLWLERSLDPKIQRVLLRDAPAVLGKRFRDMAESMSVVPLRDALASLMAAGRVRRADPEALARLVNGALVDAALWVASSGDPGKALERARGDRDVAVGARDGARFVGETATPRTADPGRRDTARVTCDHAIGTSAATRSGSPPTCTCRS